MIKWGGGSNASHIQSGVAGLHTHKFADTAEIPGFQSAGAAEGKKRDEAVRATYGWNLEAMKRFITRLAILRVRPFMANQIHWRYWWLFILKIAKKSAVWLENVRNIKGKDFFRATLRMERAGNILPCLEMILQDRSVRGSEFWKRGF